MKQSIFRICFDMVSLNVVNLNMNKYILSMLLNDSILYVKGVLSSIIRYISIFLDLYVIVFTISLNTNMEIGSCYSEWIPKSSCGVLCVVSTGYLFLVWKKLTMRVCTFFNIRCSQNLQYGHNLKINFQILIVRNLEKMDPIYFVGGNLIYFPTCIITLSLLVKQY